MQIRNFNQVEIPPAAAPASDAACATSPQGGRAETEAALLRARIEHLELVVETARSLMTANQERLLRRLHDLPQEMMALTARMARQVAAEPGRAVAQGSVE